MKISLTLLETQQEISIKIGNALLPDLRKIFAKGIKNIRTELPNIVNTAIINTPEYNSILSGKLRYEFGIRNSSSKLAGLLDTWSRNIYVVSTPPSVISGGKIIGQFSASMIKVDFSDVLYTEYAEVYDDMRGYSLPWLEWLLLNGNRTIVRNHKVVYENSPRSRTGKALMRPNSQSWSVPAEFAGDRRNNWITRALDKIGPEIDTLLKKVF
jgi:hypothetical protein